MKKINLLLLAFVVVFSFLNAQKISVSLEMGMPVSLVRIPNSEMFAQPSFEGKSLPGYSVGGVVAYGNRGEIYGGGRFVRFGSGASAFEDRPDFYALLYRSWDSRLEIPLGYRRRFDLGPKMGVLVGGAISMDIQLGRYVGFGTPYFNWNERLVLGENRIGVWNNYRNTLTYVGLEVMTEVEKTFRNSSKFFLGLRGHYCPIPQDISTLQIENPDGFGLLNIDYRGSTLNLYAGLRFGGTSREKEIQKDSENQPGLRTWFLELGGPGIPYSANYEQKLTPFSHSKWALGVRAGGYWMPEKAGGGSLGAAVISGEKAHHFETGIGAMVDLVRDYKALNQGDWVGWQRFSRFTVSTHAGYRLQRPEGGFFLRAGATAYHRIPGRQVNVWPYLGLGYSLK